MDITTDWLLANGFRKVDALDKLGNVHYRRAILGEVVGGLRPFQAADDLCIEVAVATDGEWFVWLVYAEKVKHIHVRMMRLQHEIQSLYEGLTGRAWNDPYLPPNHLDEICRLRSLVESLSDRCHRQSELLSRCAESALLRTTATQVHEALRRLTSNDPATLTLAECRDGLGAVLSLQGEAPSNA